jgi:hypothetical protein
MHRNHQTGTYGLVAIVLAALAGCFVAIVLPDVKRYLRIRRM